MRLPFFVQMEGYFVHVLRVVRGCFALKEYFVHVFRAVHGCFALEEGIGLCREDFYGVIPVGKLQWGFLIYIL